MDYLLEVHRQAHEDVERLEEGAVELLAQDVKTLHQRLIRDHKLNQILLQLAEKSRTILETYADRDGQRAREIEGLSVKRGPGGLGQFYDDVEKIKRYHVKYPNVIAQDWTLDLGELGENEEDFIDRMFSGEEFRGRYLDLNFAHDSYINLKDVKRTLSYLAYLEGFGAFANVSETSRSDPAYQRHLVEVIAYLRSFWKRTRPLLDVEEMVSGFVDPFDKRWTEERASRASPKTVQNGEAAGNGDTAMDDSNDLYCRACRKSYSKQTVYDAHLGSKKHQAKAQALGKNERPNGASTSQKASADSASRDRERLIARDEHIISSFAKELQSVIQDTKANVERKQALTDQERQAELEGSPAEDLEITEGAVDQDDDDDERITNPLKLPLGWDGKPIPFWLYKLHGLGVEYPCEICSGQVYRGRKNFERHFQEPRHSFGLKALGLPNTRHFYEITKVADAMALAEKLKYKGRMELAARENQEEVEDAQGNVFPKKVWEDLKRQGLV